MVKVLVTGGTGFIGQSLVRAMVEQEKIEYITLFVRSKQARQLFPDDKKLHFFEGDLSRPFSEQQKRIFQSHDEVYHLASCTLLSSEESKRQRIFSSNVDGTRNLLEVLSAISIEKLVYVSSAYACGKGQSNVPENWMLKPSSFRNPYEESKFFAESLIREYHEKSNLPYIIARPSIVFDPSPEGNGKDRTLFAYGKCIAKAAMIALKESDRKPIRLKGNKNPRVNIILLSTLIEELLKLKDAKPNVIYNLVSEEPTLIQPLVNAVAESIHFTPGYIFDPYLDNRELSQPEQLAYLSTQSFLPYLLEDSPSWETQYKKDQGKIKKIELESTITKALKKFFSSSWQAV